MKLENGGFEDGWLTLNGGNQQPNYWVLGWADVGTQLLAPKAGAGDAIQDVRCVPECVHKEAWQLPAAEQLGGPKALILDGDKTFKLFGQSAFRVTLEQEFTVDKGTHGQFIIPVNVHGNINPDTNKPWNVDVGAAYWRVTVNGYPGQWNTFGDFQDRTWLEETVSFVAYYGIVHILLEMECHTLGGVSFFTDNIRYTELDAPQPVECPKPRDGWTSRTTVLVRADAPDDVWLEACQWANDPTRRHSVDKSWDHAFYAPGLEDVSIILWMDNNTDAFRGILDWGEQYYHDIPWSVTVHYPEGGDPPLPPPPPTDFTPTNYVPVGTKLGFHAIGDAGQTDLFRQCVALGCEPPSVKAVQDIGWLSIIKGIAPHVKTIGRFIDDGKGGGSLEGFSSNLNPVNQAIYRMNALSPLIEPHKAYVDYWEIVNEQDPQGAEGHEVMARFFINAMDIAENWGLKLALFSYSMGVPEPDEWDAIAETGVFEKAASGRHSISLHEYGQMPTDIGSLLGRYEALTDILKARRLSIPIYITEYAPDAWTLGNATSIIKAFESRSRNVSYKEYEAAQFMLSMPNRTKYSIADGMGTALGMRIAGVEAALMASFTDDQLMSQVAQYDALVAQNPYIAGINIFTVGGFGSWPQFDQRWIKLYPRFTQYFDSVKGRVNG